METHHYELESPQLAALAGVVRGFERARIPYWLFGGWAVDFYAGSVTRAHYDIDMAIWLEDLPRISELLTADGWRHVPSEDDDGGTGYERGGIRLELTYLVHEEGRILTPLREGQAVWSEDSFGDDARELLGVCARIIALASLAAGKSTARDDPDDAAKDRADFSVLSRLGDTTSDSSDSTQ